MQSRSVTVATIIAIALAMPALAAQESTTQVSPTQKTNNQPSPTQQTADQLSPAQQTADRDFGKVSNDGFNAFRDVRSARLAIFDGKPEQAQKEIKAAATSLQKASTDDSVFVRAEADLKTPKGMTQPTSTTASATSGAIQWLPVDGTMTIGEDYVNSPQKAAGVAKANAQLKSGDHAHALETLKLAGVDVSFDTAVAPLQKSIAGVNQAEQLADAGKYYEANQALKGVQDGIRFDEQDLLAVPRTNHGDKAIASAAGK